ncbi:LytR/AlgR family response regulator transcription factor [Tellurirhabdus bombi]|uniref:LytR/AlgR family response regulator transcription factor n=1 Tax=Tellurirhabdus bombi TaxID=2907205 RepID=UPI001F3178D4|nr:LytTR family DNA-binding domain-containing protein [Tellurirhabdus bombi]
MKQRQCLIVEDSPSSVSLLKEYIARLPFFLPPAVCGTVAEALSFIQQQPFDLIFLDINLPDQSGIELLHSFPRPLPVIVTTANANYAVDSYDLDVADYLLKPFTFQRFTRALNRALGVRFVNNSLIEQEFVYLKIGHTVQRFDYADIDFIQAYGIYCKISSSQKISVVNDAISNLENNLPKQQFLRIHKSYIINLSKISSYTYRNVTIGNNKIPIGAAYRDRFEGFLRLLDRKSDGEE